MFSISVSFYNKKQNDSVIAELFNRLYFPVEIIIFFFLTRMFLPDICVGYRVMQLMGFINRKNKFVYFVYFFMREK